MEGVCEGVCEGRCVSQSVWWSEDGLGFSEEWNKGGARGGFRGSLGAKAHKAQTSLEPFVLG